MMHQENWIVMTMMIEQKHNDMIQESNKIRLANCCKKAKPSFNKMLVPLFKQIQMEKIFSKPAILDLID
jgi:hypothetical protein